MWLKTVKVGTLTKKIMSGKHDGILNRLPAVEPLSEARVRVRSACRTRLCYAMLVAAAAAGLVRGAAGWAGWGAAAAADAATVVFHS